MDFDFEVSLGKGRKQGCLARRDANLDEVAFEVGLTLNDPKLLDKQIHNVGETQKIWERLYRKSSKEMDGNGTNCW